MALASIKGRYGMALQPEVARPPSQQDAEKLTKLANTIDDVCFDGAIVKMGFKIILTSVTDRRAYGRCFYATKVIEIYNHNKPVEHLAATLVHEMVHAYDCYLVSLNKGHRYQNHSSWFWMTYGMVMQQMGFAKIGDGQTYELRESDIEEAIR